MRVPRCCWLERYGPEWGDWLAGLSPWGLRSFSQRNWGQGLPCSQAGRAEGGHGLGPPHCLSHVTPGDQDIGDQWESVPSTLQTVE